MLKQYTIQDMKDETYLITLFHNGKYQNSYLLTTKDELANKVNTLMASGYHRGYLSNEVQQTEILISEMQNLLKYQEQHRIN